MLTLFTIPLVARIIPAHAGRTSSRFRSAPTRGLVGGLRMTRATRFLGVDMRRKLDSRTLGAPPSATASPRLAELLELVDVSLADRGWLAQPRPIARFMQAVGEPVQEATTATQDGGDRPSRDAARDLQRASESTPAT